MRTKDVSQKGFTIVELLIAALIISVGILAWAKAQEGGIKGRATSDSITTASEFGMSLVEEMALKSQLFVSSPVFQNATVTVRGVQFTRNGTATKQKIIDGVHVWTIDVTVNWNKYGPKEVRYQRVTSGG